MKKLSVLMLAFALSACTSIGGKFHYDKVSTAITRCQTTQYELAEQFRGSFRQGMQSGYKTLTWYDYYNGGIGLLAFINDEGVVVDYASYPVGLVEINDNCGG